VPIKKILFLVNGCARKTKQVTGKSLAVTTRRMTIQQKLYLYPLCGLGIKSWEIFGAGQPLRHMPCGQSALARLCGFFCPPAPLIGCAEKNSAKIVSPSGYLTHNRGWRQKKIGHMPQ